MESIPNKEQTNEARAHRKEQVNEFNGLLPYPPTAETNPGLFDLLSLSIAHMDMRPAEATRPS